MIPEDSVTEGEEFCPLGVQCQVHCTPLSRTSTQAPAGSRRRCGERGELGSGEVESQRRR